MRFKEGYILLEVIVSLFIMVIIIGCLYCIVITSNDAKNNIEDRIELSQQSEEIDYQIKNLIEGCTNIINITTVDKKVISDLEYGNSYYVLSIKLNLKNN